MGSKGCAPVALCELSLAGAVVKPWHPAPLPTLTAPTAGTLGRCCPGWALTPAPGLTDCLPQGCSMPGGNAVSFAPTITVPILLPSAAELQLRYPPTSWAGASPRVPRIDPTLSKTNERQEDRSLKTQAGAL